MTMDTLAVTCLVPAETPPLMAASMRERAIAAWYWRVEAHPEIRPVPWSKPFAWWEDEGGPAGQWVAAGLVRKTRASNGE